MTMNPVARKLSQEDQDLIAEYLKNGGTVTVGKYSVGNQNLHSHYKKPTQEEEGND